MDWALGLSVEFLRQKWYAERSAFWSLWSPYGLSSRNTGAAQGDSSLTGRHSIEFQATYLHFLEKNDTHPQIWTSEHSVTLSNITPRSFSKYIVLPILIFIITIVVPIIMRILFDFPRAQKKQLLTTGYLQHIQICNIYSSQHRMLWVRKREPRARQGLGRPGLPARDLALAGQPLPKKPDPKSAALLPNTLHIQPLSSHS